MSSRIAHRPRYRTMRQLAQSSQHSRYEFFRRSRWTYRTQALQLEKHPLGYGLSLIPLGYHFWRGMIVRQA